ncbi:hypothetical protein KHA90_11515 [Flavobacterium psychroterrae]|uniref:Lipoprotein n=1 Tax=Flavobacterium psychroterrae TaxID=2133767 RepID=A0ABS5PCM5_9FLAO|nr:hypothetical protein [Flavobacterium psychroterrae]MBS7231653.1 hypothetical protein [Flavobacterium psychroterrae]
MKTITYFTGIIALFFLIACSDKENQTVLNNEASLPDAMLNKVAGLKVINSSINNKKHTTALLYGNQQTIQRIKGNGLQMQKGEKLVWITWHQKSDPNWIGAIIPGKLISIEIVKTVSGKENINYQKFEGNAMQIQNDTLGNHNQIETILKQKMAILP